MSRRIDRQTEVWMMDKLMDGWTEGWMMDNGSMNEYQCPNLKGIKNFIGRK